MRHELPNDKLSDLIAAIYDCALDPERWHATLDDVCAVLDFCNSGLGIQVLPSGAPLLAVTTGVSEFYRRRMFDYGPEILETWGDREKIEAYPISEPMVFSQHGDASLWSSNRYLLEWVKPQGIVDAVAMVLVRDASTFSSICFSRHETAGAIGNRETNALRLLAPHFQRASTISRVIEAKSLIASSFAAALDALASAVVLVDGDMRVVHANAAAAYLLATGDEIVEQRGVLALRDQTAGAALALAVRDADSDEANFGRRGIGIPAQRVSGAPSVMHVLPLRRGTVRPTLTPNAAAAIFVAPTAGAPAVSDDTVALLFGLTPAEVRVFSRMAKGETVAQAARSLGIGDSTVKTHLLRLFAKTGTRRQAELVKLAASLAMFV